MAFDKWTVLYSALIFLLFSIRNVTAQSCGGNFNSNYGVFASPNYPNVYNNNAQCAYYISLSTISSITLSFETFELDRSSSDYILIYCYNNISYPQQRFYWNSNIQPVSVPWCSYVRLYFYSDCCHSYVTRGFKVHYQVDNKDCGNTVFNSSSGNISSPNYPKKFDDYENCTYSIWAPESSSFTLSFNTFSLDPDCLRNWVQIRCDDTGQILPKYCGTSVPKPAYISNCNIVLIWFHADVYRNIYSGFSLHYSTTPDGCGESSYYGLSGIITSPNYPKGYNKMSCYYYLYPVSSVTLLFQSFDLEPFIDVYYGDYVQIYCYFNSTYTSQLYYYGSTLPPLLSYTLCSVIHITFYANSAVSGTGFNLKYQINPLVADSVIINEPKNFTVYVGNGVQLDCESSAYGYYPSWTLSKDGTNEDITVIASFCVLNSDYTDTYNYYVEKRESGVCNLVITSASMDETGVYTCIDVGLASISSFVTVVYPYDTDDSDVIGLAVALAISILANIGVAIFFIVRHCRKIPREEEVHCRSFTEIIFKPTARGRSKRRISFEAMAFNNPMVFFLVCIAFVSGIGITPQSCGRAIFTSPSGTISSPNYPKNYSNNEDCAYSIWAPEVSSFTLSFEAFRLEFKSDCGYDWVQIKCDNSSRISPKYCGSTLPKPTYISNCSKVLIWFHTDISVVDSGFSLQYSFASDDTTSASESCQDQSDSDAVIALAVLLALSVLGNIGTAVHFELRRRREASREEGDPSSDSRKTQATGSVHVNPPIYVVSPESSTT